jgi:hypothetical protein
LYAGRVLQIEAELFAFAERDPTVREAPHPELGALKVHNRADGAPARGLDLTYHRKPSRVILVRPVAEVEAEDVSAGIGELADPLDRRARGAERRHDFCAPVPLHLGLPGPPAWHRPLAQSRAVIRRTDGIFPANAQSSQAEGTP